MDVPLESGIISIPSGSLRLADNGFCLLLWQTQPKVITIITNTTQAKNSKQLAPIITTVAVEMEGDVRDQTKQNPLFSAVI